jgi:hypothetical protein
VVILDVCPVDPYLRRKEDFTVEALRVRLAQEHAFLVTKLKRRRSGDPRAHSEHDSVFSGQCVGVSGHVRSGPDDAHVAHQHVVELG